MAEDFSKAHALLGDKGGFKELLNAPGLPPFVKKAIQLLDYLYGGIVGTNSHRKQLRHVDRAYCIHFGPPLVFVTQFPWVGAR